jgi:hypothetical protein
VDLYLWDVVLNRCVSYVCVTVSFHYSVFDSSLSVQVEEADKSQVGGKWSSGLHCISKAGEGFTPAHHGPVIFFHTILNFVTQLVQSEIHSHEIN